MGVLQRGHFPEGHASFLDNEIAKESGVNGALSGTSRLQQKLAFDFSEHYPQETFRNTILHAEYDSSEGRVNGGGTPGPKPGRPTRRKVRNTSQKDSEITIARDGNLDPNRIEEQYDSGDGGVSSSGFGDLNDSVDGGGESGGLRRGLRRGDKPRAPGHPMTRDGAAFLEDPNDTESHFDSGDGGSVSDGFYRRGRQECCDGGDGKDPAYNNPRTFRPFSQDEAYDTGDGGASGPGANSGGGGGGITFMVSKMHQSPILSDEAYDSGDGVSSAGGMPNPDDRKKRTYQHHHYDDEAYDSRDGGGTGAGFPAPKPSPRPDRGRPQYTLSSDELSSKIPIPITTLGPSRMWDGGNIVGDLSSGKAVNVWLSGVDVGYEGDVDD